MCLQVAIRPQPDVRGRACSRRPFWSLMSRRGLNWRGRLVRYLIRIAALLLAGMLGAPAGAAPVRAAAGGDLAIVHARLYPAPGAAPIADATVIVRNGRIVAVGPGGAVRAPRRAP